MMGVSAAARPAHPKTRADTLTVIVWALFLGVLFLYAVDSFVQTPNRDSGAFLYVAKGILEGETPYIDRWDHKGPLLYLINAAGLLLSEVWGIWLVQLGFLVGTCLAAGKLLRSQFGTLATIFSLTILLVYFVEFIRRGNLSEQYALVFQFLALGLFVRVEQHGEHSSSAWVLLTLGALGGLAFLLRPNLIGIWVGMGLYWLVERDDTLRKCGWAAAGGLGVLAVFVAWFVLAGGLSAFWDAVIVYNVYHSDAPLVLKCRAAIKTLEQFSPLTWVVLLSWSIGLWQMVSGESASRGFGPLGRLAVVLLPIEIVFASLSGYLAPHYYLALLPVVCLLSARAVSLLLDELGARLPWIPVALCVVTGFMYVFDRRGNLIPDDVGKYGNLREYMERGTPVISYIREHTTEGDTILVWGARGWYYAGSGRDAPTRFFYGYPLVKQGYTSPELIAEFTADIIASPPVLIVETYNRRLPHLRLTDVEREQWRPRHTRYTYYVPDQFRPFFEFVEARYMPPKPMGKYDIYHLRGPALDREEEF